MPARCAGAFAQAREDARRRRSRLARAARAAARVGAEFEVLAHRQVGEDAPPFGHLDQPGRDDVAVVRAGDVARRRSAPARSQAGTRPQTMLLSVDLPAPLLPSSATISPGCTCQVDAAQHLDAAVAAAQVADLQQCASCHPPAAAGAPPCRGRGRPR